MKVLAAKLDRPPVEFACSGCETIAQTQGLSTPPHGWKRAVDGRAWPERCVTWRCGACVKAGGAGTAGE